MLDVSIVELVLVLSLLSLVIVLLRRGVRLLRHGYARVPRTDYCSTDRAGNASDHARE